MPHYKVTMLTQSGRNASQAFKSLMEGCLNQLWSRSAVVADLEVWGTQQLAYRIRKQGVNHYEAYFHSLHVYCSPPALRELEGTLRTSDHVLRWMARRERLEPLDKAARFPHRPKPPANAEDLEADGLERRRWEYRNLVMQRVFEGRTKAEIVAEHLQRHRALPQATMAAARASARPVLLEELAPDPLGPLFETPELPTTGRDGGQGGGSGDSPPR